MRCERGGRAKHPPDVRKLVLRNDEPNEPRRDRLRRTLIERWQELAGACGTELHAFAEAVLGPAELDPVLDVQRGPSPRY